MSKRLSEKTRFKDKDLNKFMGYINDFLSETDPDIIPISMDDLDDYFKSPYDAIRSAFNGERFGYKQDVFNPNDEYFSFNGYGNLVSIPYIDDYYSEQVDEDYFREWLVEQGYLDEEY